MTMEKLSYFQFFDTVELANILYSHYFDVKNDADNIAVQAICARADAGPFSMPLALEIVADVQSFRTKGYKDAHKEICNTIAPAIVTRFYYTEV